jgi:serine/threonine protein kinase
MLASHLAHVGAARERFAREGRAAAAVVHEHVVSIYNVETSGETPFLVMQYVPGRSLQARVDAEGPLAVEEILRIGMQAASGLAAAHAQGLVHRDVKPSNILLEETVERAVLTDFGLARAIDDASLTRTGVLAGTPHYMSPEQATGAAIDHRSDLFSLGAVLYFMATGHPPFRADGALAVLHRICREPHRPVWQTNKEIPDELSDLIDELLEKKPSRRPVAAAVVRDRLSALLSRLQQYGPARRRLYSLRSRRLRKRVLVAATVILAMLAVILGAYRVLSVPAMRADDSSIRVDSFDMTERFDHLVEAENAFNHDIQSAHDAVTRWESETSFASPVDAQWRARLDSIQRDLTKLESELGISPE